MVVVKEAIAEIIPDSRGGEMLMPSDSAQTPQLTSVATPANGLIDPDSSGNRRSRPGTNDAAFDSLQEGGTTLNVDPPTAPSDISTAPPSTVAQPSRAETSQTPHPTKEDAKPYDATQENKSEEAGQSGQAQESAEPSGSLMPAPLCGILEGERAILGQIQYSMIPKVIDAFQVNDRCYLILEYLPGRNLRDAWNAPEATDAQRVDWLIQLCQSLAKVHAQGVLYNAIAPERLLVDERGRLVLPDFSSAIKLPASDGSVNGTRFTAPELVLDPAAADLQADLYSFGATWYSLLMGRDLSDDDFETEFVPRLNPSQLNHGDPLLVRLLLKTFQRDPGRRFPTEEELAGNPPPTAELRRHLLVYKRRLMQPALAVGAQTSIGVVRTANEDNYFAWKTSWKTGDESQQAALVVLADGMGGNAAGEVASEIAVGVVREALVSKMQDWAEKSPEEQGVVISSAIDEAIQRAHAEVRNYCVEYPEAQGLACTLDVTVVLGSQAIIGHVGDSRVGIVNREGTTWITEDQTIVSRLVKLRMVSDEEAATHPDRSTLLQAIGGGKKVEPAIYRAALQRGDHLICCSDGLTGHVGNEEIRDIVLNSPSPQVACNRLVNGANIHGGTDNITVVLASIT
jgi:protein phosphatase